MWHGWRACRCEGNGVEDGNAGQSFWKGHHAQLHKALTSDEGTDRKGKGTHQRHWIEGTGLTKWCFRNSGAVVESTGEGKTGGKILKEELLRKVGAMARWVQRE